MTPKTKKTPPPPLSVAEINARDAQVQAAKNRLNEARTQATGIEAATSKVARAWENLKIAIDDARRATELAQREVAEATGDWGIGASAERLFTKAWESSKLHSILVPVLERKLDANIGTLLREHLESQRDSLMRYRAAQSTCFMARERDRIEREASQEAFKVLSRLNDAYAALVAAMPA